MESYPEELEFSRTELQMENDKLRGENARLRDVLENYACPGLGNCSALRLKDGTCINESSGTCGHAAHAALTSQ